VGQSRSSVEHLVGALSTHIDVSQFPLAPPLSRSTCVYYSEADVIVDGFLHRLCYVADRLASKDRYDSQGPVPDSTVH
jgi:hypothetical protein